MASSMFRHIVSVRKRGYIRSPSPSAHAPERDRFCNVRGALQKSRQHLTQFGGVKEGGVRAAPRPGHPLDDGSNDHQHHEAEDKAKAPRLENGLQGLQGDGLHG